METNQETDMGVVAVVSGLLKVSPQGSAAVKKANSMLAIMITKEVENKAASVVVMPLYKSMAPF